MPLEVSTSARVKVIGLGATVFGGIGGDLIEASTQASIDLEGDVFGRNTNGGEEVWLGFAGAELVGNGTAIPTSARAFAGAQLDIWILKLYGQLNVGTGNRLGAHAGVRVKI